MKKLLLVPCLLTLAACASGSKSSLNCEKLEADSQAKLVDMQAVFLSYQNINYDLAMKLAGPLKDEVDQLDTRIRNQKTKCWPGEKKEIDVAMGQLKDELFKVYGGPEPKRKAPPKHRMPASEAPVQPAEVKMSPPPMAPAPALERAEMEDPDFAE